MSYIFTKLGLLKQMAMLFATAARRRVAILPFIIATACALQTQSNGAVLSYTGGEKIWVLSSSWLPAGSLFPNSTTDRVYINNGTSGATQTIYLNSSSPITLGYLEMANYAIYQGAGTGGLVIKNSLDDGGLNTSSSTGNALIASSLTINDRVFSNIASGQSMTLQGPVKIGGDPLEAVERLERTNNGILHISGALSVRPDGQLWVSSGSGTINLSSSASNLAGSSSGVMAQSGTINFGGSGVRSTASLTTSNSITLTGPGTVSNAGLQAGMVVQGAGIPVGTVITNITGNVLTLSNSITELFPANSNISFGGPSYTSAASAAGGTTSVTLSAVNGLSVGMLVSGGNVPAGAKITAISGNTITLSSAFTGSGLSSGDLLGFGGTTVGGPSYQSQATSASGAINATTLTLTAAGVGGLRVGMQVNANGIPIGTTITGIDGTTNTITLSNKLTAAIASGASIDFMTRGDVPPTTILAAAAVSGATSVNLKTATGLSIGMIVTGKGIASGTTITGISGSTITLSNGITAALSVTDALSFGPASFSSYLRATASSGSTLSVMSVEGLVPGMLVTGPNIPIGTVINSVDAATRSVTLSAAITAAISEDQLILFGRGGGQHTFQPGSGTLLVNGGTVNFGTNSSAANVAIDIDKIQVTGGAFNLRNGSLGGVTTLRPGATNTLTLNGGTTNLYSDANAVGAVIFPQSASLQMNNSAVFSFAGPQDVNTAIVSLSGSSSTTLRSTFGNATLSVGGDGINDVFSGALNMSGAGTNSFLIKVGSETLTLSGSLDNPGAKVRINEGKVVLDKASTPGIHAIGSTFQIGDADSNIETATIAGTYAGLGSVPLPNFRDQIFRGVTVDFTHSTGTLDLNGFSEGINVLAGNGLVTNNGSSVGTLIVGENSAGFTYSGRIQNGLAPVSFWKTGSATTNLRGDNTFTASSTGGTASGSTTMLLPSVANLSVGMIISGTGIQQNTEITAINTSNNSITLSAATNAATTAATAYTIFANSSKSTSSVAAGATTITLSSSAGLTAGMQVNGLGLLPGTKISSIAGNIITLNIPTAQATSGSTAYSFSPPAAYSYTGETVIGRGTLTLEGVNGALVGTNAIRVATGGMLFVNNATSTTPSSQLQTSGVATSASTSVTVGNAAGLYVGMRVSGSGIPADTVVTAISGTTLTLSRTSTIPASSSLTFGGIGELSQDVVTPTVSSFASGVSSINVSNITGINIGTMITGTGITTGTFVTGISGTTLTLNNATTAVSSGSYKFATQNRINDTSDIVLDRGGLLTVRRTTLTTANGGDVFENMGTLKVLDGFGQVRTQHSDGSGSGNGIIASNITLRFADYQQQQGGVVAFTTDNTSNAATGFTTLKTGVTPDKTGSRVAFANVPSAFLVGDSVGGADVDTKVLIGAYGGTTNGAVDRLVTVESFGGLNYVRMLDVAQAGDYSTNLSAATTLTSGNLALGGNNTRDDNLRLAMASSGTYLIDIDPSSNVHSGRQAFNSLTVSSAANNTLRISEQNTLHLGGFAGNALCASTDGSGMVLINTGTFAMRGGTLDFYNREAIIRANANGDIYSEITGSKGMTKSGGARLALFGQNDYAGITTVTQGDLLINTNRSLGATGLNNGSMVTNAQLSLDNGINIGGFGNPTSAESLTLNWAGNLRSADRANFWNGQVLLNNAWVTGQGGFNNTIQVDGNAILTLNGGLTGMSGAMGGDTINPTYTNNQEGRGIIFTNGGSGTVRKGLIRINGVNSADLGMLDEDFAAATANHQKLNLVIRGYTGQASATNSEFNLVIEDASSNNGFIDLRSGYLYLNKGYGSSDQNTLSYEVTENGILGDYTLTLSDVTGLLVGSVLDGPGLEAGTTVSAINGNIITLSAPLIEDVATSSTLSSSTGGQGLLIRQHDGGNVSRPGTISAVLLSDPGASFRAPTMSLGENTGAFSSKSLGLLGGINQSGTVSFGNSRSTLDMNPIAGNYTQGKSLSAAAASGASTLTLNNTDHLKVGMRITGTGILPGTSITSIAGNLVTLSQNTSGAIASGGGVTLGMGIATATSTGPSITKPRGAVTLTAAASAGATTLTVSSANDLAVGMPVLATGVKTGTTISSISGNVLTISSPTDTAIANGTTLQAGISVNSVPVSVGNDTIGLNNVAGLYVGMIVSGAGIPANATIVNVDDFANTIQISAAATSAASVGNVYNFDNPNGSSYLSLTSTDNIVVGSGISGPGIQTDTIVAAIDSTNNVITLSRPLNASTGLGNSYSYFTPTTSLTLTNVDGLEVGMGISGTGISPGVVITNISGNTITISSPTTANLDLNTIIASPLPVVSVNIASSASSGATLLTLSSIDGLSVGSTVQGGGIVNGTTITAINAATNTITLSLATTATLGANSAINVRKFSNFAETRLYQAEGGISDLKMRFTDDGGFSLNNEVGALTKVGLGTTILSGSSTGGGNDLDGGINLMGGKLELAYGALTNNTRVGSSASPHQLTVAGGELEFSNSAGILGITSEAFRGNFTIRPGSSALTTNPAFSSQITVNLGQNNTVSGSLLTFDNTQIGNPSFYWREPDRYAGGVVQFNYDHANNGLGEFFYSQSNLDPIGSGSGQLGYATIIPYGTVKSFDIGNSKVVVDFAAFTADISGGLAQLFIEGLTSSSANSYIDNSPNVSNWHNLTGPSSVVNGNIIDETPSAINTNVGYTGTLQNNADGTFNKNNTDFLGAKVIRFMADTATNLNTVNLGGNRLVLGSGFVNNFITSYQGYAATRDGGAILVSNLVGGDDQLISNGTLTSAYQSTTFSRSTMVAPNDRRQFTYDSRDLIIHNYNTSGLFRISATIADYVLSNDIKNPDGSTDTVPGKLNLVISGPGTTRLENNNTFTGTTYVSGGLDPVSGTYSVGTLLVQAEARLGPVPTSATTDNIYLNGGRLEFASDTSRTDGALGAISLASNRGIMLGGNGGYIKLTNSGTTLSYSGVIQSQPNVLSTTAASQQMTENIGVGDFYKEGNGRLILTNSTAVGATGWNAYYGLTEVRGGSLQLNISTANSGILGSGTTTIDRTSVLPGARLDFQITGGSGNGTYEWITLKGGVLGTTSGHLDGTLDGVIDIESASLIDIVDSGTLRFNSNSGYLRGKGNLEKVGSGTLILAENNSDYSGAWSVRGGSIVGSSQGLPFGVGNSLSLGEPGTVGASSNAGIYLRSRTSFTTIYEVGQNISVVAEASGNQTKELGASNLSATGYNNDRYQYKGDISLLDDVSFVYFDERANANLAVITTNPQGSNQTGVSRYLAFDGDIAGIGNIQISTKLFGAGAQSVVATYEFNGVNTAWSGGVTMGNAISSPEQTSILRLGSSSALQSDNWLVMNYNNRLQVAGQNVTMGNLTINPAVATGTGATTGDIVIENASNSLATLTINQIIDENWDAIFRDGVTPDVYSQSCTYVHDAPLNLAKTGNAVATLTQTNIYTGSTTVLDGVLQAGANNVIPDGSGIFITPSTGSDTASISLNGFNDTLAFITMGGATSSMATLATGSGTVTLNGNVTYLAGAPAPTGIATSGSSTVSVSGATGILAVGTPISGVGIVPGTFITAVSGDIVTLSAPTNGAVSGSITLGQSAVFGANPGEALISGNLALGTSNRTFLVENSANAAKDLTVSAIISGTSVGVIKDGAGLLEFSADNNYTGTTTVKAGVLQLQSSDTGAAGAGNTTVLAGATISGVGTLSGTAGITNHVLAGILSPGDITVTGSTGTLNVLGNLDATASTAQVLMNLFSPTGTYSGPMTDLAVGNPNYNAALNSLVTSFGTSQAGVLDHLNGLGSTLTLSGSTSITVSAVTGGTPFAVGQVFNLLDWATITPGGFDLGGNQRNGGLVGDLSLPSLSGTLAWDTTKFFSDGMLVIVQVPEPSRTLLLLMSLMAICMRRRRSLAA